MTDRENVLGLAKRTGYESMPVYFYMTPECKRKFQEYCEQTGYVCPEPAIISIPWSDIEVPREQDFWRQFYDYSFKDGTTFDYYGVAAEPGSEACFHMTKMHHPLENATELSELQAYPFPKFVSEPSEKQIEAVKRAHEAGKFALGDMQCTIWETSWYARSMESLMMDMLTEPEMANFVLDTVMENAIRNATNFVKAGVDGLFLGDDIGMQHSIMMSLDLYREYIKPRLKRVIEEARAINPDIVIFYHSCGYVTPFIPDLIEVGVDVLNPLQTECMDFEEIYKEFGGQISFCGALGTQTLMPFGTPEEIRDTVKKYLDIAGPKGGLIVCPTHILEPEVPAENIVAYIEACKAYGA